MKTFTVGAEVLGFLVAALMLGGCAVSVPLSNPVAEEPQMIWGRIDCQRGEGNPEILKEFEGAKALCRSRGESAEMVAGTAGTSACMTEQGYILRTPKGHGAACEAIRPAKQRK